MRRPTVTDPAVLAVHLEALRLIAMHGGSFDHTCSAAQCTRRAHWRYFPERNPQLADIVVTCGGVEVYEVAGEDGYPQPHEGGGYCVLRREDGPAGSLYTGHTRHDTYAEALRAAAELAIIVETGGD